MKREIIHKELTDIFRNVFDDEDIILTDATCADDIEDWDSLAQITLISEIEKKFSIKLGLKEVMVLNNVGEMMDLIGKSVER